MAMRCIKLVLVGTRGVGKTCLAFSFTSAAFPGATQPTPFFDNHSVIQYEDRLFNLGIWVSIGDCLSDLRRIQQAFSDMFDYFETNVFLLCFSLTSRSSFDEIWDGWYYELHKHCPDCPVVLVGTKLDLRKKQPQDCIATPEGTEMARKIGAQAYIECSALTQENLNKAFMTCIAASLGELQISTTKKQSRKGIMAQVKSIFSKPQKPQPPSSAINFQEIPSDPFQALQTSYAEVSLWKLPVHLLQLIFSYFSPGNIVTLCRVSKTMNVIGGNARIWEPFCQAIDGSVNLRTANKPLKALCKSMTPVWINDMSVAPLPAPDFTHHPLSF